MRRRTPCICHTYSGMPQGPLLSEFDAVLFDVDGTLVDTLPMLVKGLGDAYEHFNGERPSDEMVRSLIGLPLSRQMAMFRTETPPSDQLDQMSRYAIERFDAYKSLATLFEPAVDALRLCKQRGLKTALVTSKSRTEVDGFLPTFDARDSVDTVVCASDVVHPKPAPDSALLACERLGVSPSRALMVGDSIYDLRCARAAGIGAVAVAYGASDAPTLLAEQPLLLLSTPEALYAWVDETLN